MRSYALPFIVGIALAVAPSRIARAGEHPAEHPTGGAPAEHPAPPAPSSPLPAAPAMIPPSPPAPSQATTGQPTAPAPATGVKSQERFIVHTAETQVEEPVSPEILKQRFSKAVEDHVAKESREQGGAFVVADDKLGKLWRLKLVRIHKDRIVQLAPNKFFACADFQEPAGEGTKLDLDFFVTKMDKGWNVDQVLIHKVSGKPRYTYNDKNERVPVE